MLNLIGALILTLAFACLWHSASMNGHTQWLRIVVAAALAFATVGLAILIIRVAPRAIEFQDRKYLHSAARELRQSKARFERAIDGSFSGLWEWNIDSNAVWYSSHFRELLGYSSAEEFPDELDCWKAALHPEDSERTIQALSSHLDEQGAFDVEYRLRRKSGDYRWFGVGVLAILNKYGNQYLLSVSFQDFHEGKQADEALRRRDEYLNQKQKMEALGELAGGTAHEFNNLLQAISGQLQFAERALPAQSDARKELTVASDLIKQSACFTRQLLDFSRRSPRDIHPICPNEVVDQLAVVLHSMLGGQIELQVRLGRNTGHVMADAAALQQVLLNLAINARDAMPNGGKLVIRTCPGKVQENELLAFPDAIPGAYVVISVSDTGCGMTEETKSRMFEPFFTTKAIGEGTGLGLAVAYNTVKEFGGFIDVESWLGHGTTFTIWLPAAEVRAKPRAVDTSCLADPHLHRGATILYAEDSETVLRAVTHELTKHGYRVIAASDGLSAVRLFEVHQSEIDLALLDVILPHMGGDEVLYQLRERRPDLPVIFCSGSVSHLLNQEVLDNERIWLIDKPFESYALLDIIDEALSDQSECRASHA
jgi:PAS domain S-box-containing protein